MASYSDSLLLALKPKRIACSILSPIEEVNSKPMPTPGLFFSGRHRAAKFLRGSQLRLAPSSKVSACIGYHTLSIPLPNRPSFRTYQVYELCPEVADQLTPQQGEPRSMGGAFGRLSGGLKQLVRGGYIWSPLRSRTC